MRPFSLPLVLAVVMTSNGAYALQPLSTFLERANADNPDVRAARSTEAQKSASVDRATAALLPSVQAQGTYTYNQYEVSFPASTFGGTGTLTIVPKNQLDGSIQANVPIVDVGAWMKRSSAKATRESASADTLATKRSIAKQVVQAYYQVLANEAVLASAERSVAIARENAGVTANKREGGTASDLDVNRSKADIAKSEQDLATAKLQRAKARRSLESLTGVVPEDGGALPPDDLHRETPMDQWLGAGNSDPSVRSARASERAAQKNVDAAKSAWLPTISGNAQEKFTNAPSLTLHNEYYLLQLTATWKLDFSIPAAVREQNAAAAVASAKSEKARRDAADDIFDDWQQVDASVDKARAARAQVTAASAAATLAVERYRGGIATQLDVLQSEQDAFSADVNRIQAEADLALARASLRLDASQPLPGGER